MAITEAVMGTGTDNAKASEVQSMMSMETQYLDGLMSKIDNLQDRISSVLREATPDATCEDEPVLGSKFARKIQEHNGAIVVAINRLEDIISRCEL